MQKHMDLGELSGVGYGMNFMLPKFVFWGPKYCYIEDGAFQGMII